MAHRTHLILGATGLVGREFLQQLLADERASRVVVIARRPTGLHHAKLEEHVFDLAKMHRHADVFAVDTIFCALGTTIKKAGSQARFREIDHDLPLQAARLGLANGARHYLLVSSLGANPGSGLFYSRVKGEVEEDLRVLGYPQLTIARPSLLLGVRDEIRLGERLFPALGWLMPPKYRPIEARDVARAMVALANEDGAETRVVEARELRRIAAKS